MTPFRWLAALVLCAAPFAYTAEESRLIAELKANPKDAALLTRLGKSLAARHAYERAQECFELLAEGNPAQPAYRVAIARCAMRLGKKQLARDQAQELLRRFPDSPPVEKLLAELGAGVPPRRDVSDASELRKILIQEHCFLFQERVRAGLARYNTSKGTGLTLRAHNWSKIISDLAKHGYLERAWLEPGGAEYRSRPDGTVSCTEHGEAARAPLPRSARVRVRPAALDEVLAKRDPATVVGIALLAAGEERVDLVPRLLPLVPLVADAASLCAALEVLGGLVPSPGLPPAEASLVRAFEAHADAEVRARAALLWLRLGAEPAVDAAAVVTAVALAGREEAAPSEIARLVALVPEAKQPELAAFAAAMTDAQALIAAPGLARSRDPAVTRALEKRMAAPGGSNERVREVIRASLEAARR